MPGGFRSENLSPPQFLSRVFIFMEMTQNNKKIKNDIL